MFQWSTKALNPTGCVIKSIRYEVKENLFALTVKFYNAERISKDKHHFPTSEECCSLLSPAVNPNQMVGVPWGRDVEVYLGVK
jgi:hypothetical protein